MSSNLELPLEHFQLQAQYAQIAAETLQIPIEQACLEFTQFWRRVGNNNYSFDPNVPHWQDYVHQIHCGRDIAIAAYDLYSQNTLSDQALGKVYFGCFRFDFNPIFTDQWGVTHKNVIKLHFRNNDSDGIGPLATSKISLRLDELRSMFEFIKEIIPQAEVVHGGTWLYNRKEYCRLFPWVFTAEMLVEETPFPRTTGIWGQFLKSNKTVDMAMAHEFLMKARLAQTREQLLQAFKYRILFPRAPIQAFHDLYDLIRIH